MTLVNLYDSGTMRPNLVDVSVGKRRSIVTALELRLFHQADTDSRGIVRFTFTGQDNVTYTTAVKLTPDGCLCPCCGAVADELCHHPADRGLACPSCVKRLGKVAKAQARPAKPAHKPRQAKGAYTCQGKTRNGAPCRNRVAVGEFCAAHQDQAQEKSGRGLKGNFTHKNAPKRQTGKAEGR